MQLPAEFSTSPDGSVPDVSVVVSSISIENGNGHTEQDGPFIVSASEND